MQQSERSILKQHGVNQFNYLRRAQGAQAPCYRIFCGFFYNLPIFKQDEMGAKKIKRQDFLIEVSAFFIIF
jgi:hypothetical protein